MVASRSRAGVGEGRRPCAGMPSFNEGNLFVEEVVLQFTAKPGLKVRIAIEIQAETGTGFDDNLQRAVKENCKVLKFKSAEFEAGE